MMARVVSSLLVALGVAAIAIGAAIFIFGPQATANAFAAAMRFATGISTTPDLAGADIDSELRFYAVFWIAYGAFVLRAAKPDRLRKGATVPLLLGLFFAGGVGRLLSFFAEGSPHPLFVALMAVELAAPPIILLLWRALPPR